MSTARRSNTPPYLPLAETSAATARADPLSAAGPPVCFHGGAFFEAIGVTFDDLGRKDQVISADVLDAWFPPAPEVVRALLEELPWLLRTSPPMGSEGLVQTIAQTREIDPASVLAGAGSSDLIFLALREWLNSRSRVLILDPTYGEYPHVLEQVIGCHVDRFVLQRSENFEIDPSRFSEAVSRGYDLVALVNPNSPTGRYFDHGVLEGVIREAPHRTRFWIDETYVDYLGAGHSLERFASSSTNAFVCKSMSKVYALSGVRVAYLCGPPAAVEQLARLSPPWAVSLLGQVAGVHALKAKAYYRRRYDETHTLRRDLACALRERCGTDVLPGVANFVLCHLREGAMDAASLVEHCRKQGLFLRDASGMGKELGQQAVRIAVQDAESNRRMIDILRGALRS